MLAHNGFQRPPHPTLGEPGPRLGGLAAVLAPHMSTTGTLNSAAPLWRRRADVLAYFDHHASNGPTEAINGRLEALRRNALGFRNLTHYRLHSLLHCGNLAQRIDAL